MEKVPGHNFNKNGETLGKMQKKLPLEVRVYAFYEEPQSNLPLEFDNPEKLKYYSDLNIEDVKIHFNKLKEEVLKSNMTYSIDWSGNEFLPVSEIFEYLEKSIIFSEDVNKKRKEKEVEKYNEIIQISDEKRRNLIDMIRKKRPINYLYFKHKELGHSWVLISFLRNSL